MSEGSKIASSVAVGITVITVIMALTGLTMWGWPHYKVYEQQLRGEATLREAESSRQVAVEEARAKLEAAKMLAEAEVERAKGVAEANKIIGESLAGHDEYLRYLWITNLEQGQNRETIYVPTEAGIPILEAERLNR